jgi:protein-L-isoaspartate O-methyltransferase
MKLTVELLDNQVKSAVINVGKNSGYVEAYLDKGNLAVYVFDKSGQVLLERFIPLQALKAEPGSGYTSPKFEPSLALD